MDKAIRRASLWACVAAAAALLLACGATTGEASLAGRTDQGASGVVVIKGRVTSELRFGPEELSGMATVETRSNGVDLDGTYHGVFRHKGVPLRELLDRAGLAKQGAEFDKPLDLVVVVKGRSGKKVALSWGEIYYHNPGDAILAVEAAPVMPHKPCAKCHDETTYGQRLGQLTRKVGLPRLVVARDFYADRCVEDVIEIEVVQPRPGVPTSKPDKLFSPRFSLMNAARKETTTIEDLSGLPRTDVAAVQTGDGIGYHGVRRFSGVPLRDALAGAGVSFDAGQAFLVIAADGYRASVSSGELFLQPDSSRIILADEAEGKAIDDGGKFHLVTPDDFAADRWVKAVSRIDTLAP
ncbi:MAG: hypothetical protein PHU25_21000 [Deltaproteobacteria bacterium]|nr:hypothetical protein [Deltaproteobacteria bacterium]